MASNYPEYRSKERIQPAASPTGEHQAIAGITSTFDTMASMASEAAAKNAQELSVEAGTQAGRKPGARAISPIFANDKLYNQALLSEQANVLSYQGNELLNTISSEISKNPNPTSADFMQYEKAALNGIDKLIAQSDPKIREQLKRTLYNKYTHGKLQLSQRIEQANIRRLRDSSSVASRANLDNIYSYATTGDIEAARDAYNQEVINNSNAVAMNAKTRNEADVANKAAKISLQSGIAQHDMMSFYDLEGEKGAGNYIKKFSEEKQEGISEAEKIPIVNSLLSKLGQVKKINAQNDQLLLQEATMLMNDYPGGILPINHMERFQEQMSESAFNRLQISQMQEQEKQQDISAMTQFIMDNSDNKVILDSVGDKEKDVVFGQLLNDEKERLGRDLEIEDVANVASRYDTNFKTFTNMASSGVMSNNPEVSAKWAGIVGGLLKRNSNVVKGLDKDAQTKAHSINMSKISGKSSEEAVSDYEKDKDWATKEGRKEMDKRFNAELQERKVKNPLLREKQIANLFNVDMEQITGDAQSDFDRIQMEYYRETGKWNESLELAQQEMLKTWRETNINGNKQLMKNAPNIYFNDMRKVRAQMYDTVMNVLIDANRAFDDKNIPSQFKYEIAPVRTLKGPLVEGNVNVNLLRDRDMEFRVIRKDAFGNEVKGIIQIASDSQTMISDTMLPDSYALKFFPDGAYISQPITGAYVDGEYNTNKENRFKVNTEKLAEGQVTKEQLIEAQKRRFNVVKAKAEVEKAPWYYSAIGLKQFAKIYIDYAEKQMKEGK